MNIDNLRQLLDEATPGPWQQGTGVHDNVIRAEGDFDWVGVGGTRHDTRDPVFRGQVSNRDGQHVADARAIVALRNAAPDLLAAVEALERLTDAAGPIGEDDGPDHIFAPTDPEWQEFEAALADARAVLRRLRGEGPRDV